MAQSGLVPDGGGVYVSRWNYGSPAQTYALWATYFLVEVDEKRVRCLSDLVAAIKTIPDDTFVKVRIVDLQGREKVIMLKTDIHYWLPWELRRDESGVVWRLTPLI